MQRLIASSRGSVHVDIWGTEQQAFAHLVLFDSDGRPLVEDMWSSAQGEALDAFLLRVAGVHESEAERAAGTLLREWRQSGGPQEDARRIRQFTAAVLGSLLAVAAMTALTAIVVTEVRRRTRQVGWSTPGTTPWNRCVVVAHSRWTGATPARTGARTAPAKRRDREPAACPRLFFSSATCRVVGQFGGSRSTS